MKVKVTIFSIAAAVAAVLSTLMITAATHGLTDLAFAQGGAKFGFNLTGSEEVPPVQTNATGMAEISAYTVAGDAITYSVNAMNIQGVTAGHIHLGKPGENGPIVFTMFNMTLLGTRYQKPVQLQLINSKGQWLASEYLMWH
jgi:hypothetical protein